MKKILAIVLFAILGVAVQSRAQAVALPSATASTITVPVSGGNCTAANTCVGTVFLIQGACPASLAGSPGWTAAATFAEPGTASVVLSTGILPNTLYSIVVEAAPTNSPTSYNGPSNCASITTPFHPALLTLGTLSAS